LTPTLAFRILTSVTIPIPTPWSHAMRVPHLPLFPLLIAALLLTSCSDDDTPTAPVAESLAVTLTAVEANEHNPLSLVVTGQATAADSVRVVFGIPGADTDATPWQPAVVGGNRLVALGLLADTDYAVSLEAKRGAATASSAVDTARSGALPAALAERLRFQVEGTPPPGYIVTGLRIPGASEYMVVFDTTGRLVWYRRFDILGAVIGMLPNGNFTAYLGRSQGFQPTYGYFAEVAPDGAVVDRHEAVAPLYTDGHELMLTPRDDGFAAHLFSYSLRETDMSAYGGPTDALIGGHQILRFAPDGAVEFSWNAWDHFDLEDWIEAPDSRRQSDNADFDHPNAMDLDLDGHYVVSFRDLAEITKIDARTGALIWRLGGANNQFTFLDDPLGGFNGQHSVRVLENGHLLLYDNGLRHDPPQSRALEYALDLNAMTATLAWEYRHDPPLYTPYTGGVTRRADGNTVVQFAGVSTVTEVDPSGNVVWEGRLYLDDQSISLYRMEPVASLYKYVQP